MSHQIGTRREFLKKAALTASSGTLLPLLSASGSSSKFSRTEPEWRNRQPEMEYRMLGRTGFMVSAMVIGGGGLNPERYKFAARAVEMGVNYIDTASRYGNGRSESGIGALLKMVGRDKLFVTTKLSSYTPLIDQLCADILKSLPSEKQNSLRKQATDLLRDKGVLRQGYFFKFFPGHEEEYHEGYLTHVIRREYGNSGRWKNQIKKQLQQTIDESLIRLGTDYIDILMCPHGARLPEELDDEAIQETLEETRQAGKIRYSGLSIHSDIPRTLSHAADLGYYDTAMVAYNIVNQAQMDLPIQYATGKGMGIIAMKAASGVNPPHESLKPVPQWRIEKLNQAIPGEMKLPVKAYLWAHQNQNVAGVISAFMNEDMIVENLWVVGRKVDFGNL